ncbi:MAG: type 4a pilus biogenesis protein PilO [Candidatus Omnitrophica bacterium]|nr:type 4a pilus biogenesis protein PilO [Candidatus Omnitrophota bacterium]
MIKLLKNREKIILYLTLAVILFSLIFYFIVSPVMAKYANLNKEITVASAKLRKYMALLSQKEMIQKKYSDKFYSISSLPEFKQDSLVAALSELQNLAKGADIRIIDLRPQQGVKTSSQQYKEIIIDMRTEGSMEGYLKFIYDIENSLWILRIKKFQLLAKSNSVALEGVFTIAQVLLSN